MVTKRSFDFYRLGHGWDMVESDLKKSLLSNKLLYFVWFKINFKWYENKCEIKHLSSFCVGKSVF